MRKCVSVWCGAQSLAFPRSQSCLVCRRYPSPPSSPSSHPIQRSISFTPSPLPCLFCPLCPPAPRLYSLIALFCITFFLLAHSCLPRCNCSDCSSSLSTRPSLRLGPRFLRRHTSPLVQLLALAAGHGSSVLLQPSSHTSISTPTQREPSSSPSLPGRQHAIATPWWRAQHFCHAFSHQTWTILSEKQS